MQWMSSCNEVRTCNSSTLTQNECGGCGGGVALVRVGFYDDSLVQVRLVLLLVLLTATLYGALLSTLQGC